MKTNSYFWKNFLVFLFFIFTTTTFSQTVNFTTSGTWTCPSDVTQITISAWGAGGGGGGAANTANYRGAGGGGGAYNSVVNLAVTPNATYTITIGNAGVAGTKTVNGGKGGDTKFILTGTDLFIAAGGNGGGSQTSGTLPTAGTGGIGLFNGGNGFIGISGTGGGGGGGAGTSSNGVTAASATGGAAGTGGTGTGGTGAGCGGGGGTGCDGANYGGGGGGGNQNKNGGAGGAGFLTLSYTPSSPCTSAATLACGTTNLAGTTVGSTNFTHNIGCSMSNYGKWYTFVGDGQQTTITSIAGSGFDHEMAIAYGSCGTLTNITCLDNGFTGGTETYTFTTTNGTTYFVYIADYSSGSSTTGTFTISRTCTPAPTPPVNDNCAGAIALTVNPGTICTSTTSGTILAATNSGINTCFGTADDDVWYRFVATSTTHYVSLINYLGAEPTRY